MDAGLLGGKTSGIHRVLEAVAAMYGPDAFPLDEPQPKSPGHVGLTSARDRRFYASIIAMGGQPEVFSVQVELYEPPEPIVVAAVGEVRLCIPFELVEDQKLDLASVVELLGRYRNWVRA